MSEAAPQVPRPAKQARPRRLSCPGCGGSIEIRANGISISAICPSCGRTIDVASDDLKIIAEAQRNTRTPTIPLGTRGSLAGTEWEVVGYQSRSNPKEGWTWDEFLLFSPYRGFRFLAHDDEGWTLYAMLRQDVPDPSRVDRDTHHYAGPETSQATTDYVLGEFYWRVRVGDTAEVEQYTAGSNLLVKETSGDEIVWSRGLPVSAAAVAAAFKLAAPPPERRTVPPREQANAVLRVGIAALVLLLLLHIVSFGSHRAELVFQQDYKVTAAERGKPIASEPFLVPGNAGNVGLDVQAGISNNWLGLDLSLVGENGTPVFNTSQTVEYYSGYDDEYWTEGSQHARIVFPRVPGGNYRLIVEADSGALNPPRPPPPSPYPMPDVNAVGVGLPQRPAAAPPPPPSVSFAIQARRNVPASEWFWIALVLILPYPIYRLLFLWARNA